MPIVINAVRLVIGVLKDTIIEKSSTEILYDEKEKDTLFIFY